MEVSKKDWKLFRACIGEWQEAYMDRLTKEYIDSFNKYSQAKLSACSSFIKNMSPSLLLI